MTAVQDLRIAVQGAVFSTRGAAPARTLLDVLAETARQHPAAAAVDDGATTLSYRALATEVDRLRETLAGHGIGVGDRVGVRAPSGTVDLYVSILAVLAAGAAYVPVDFEDPQERADLVFGEADVCAVIGAGREITLTGTPLGVLGTPGLDDDAWIIFTSGSTGKPKGVAVSHRAAAAFVDAEAELFLVDEPIGPGDRVLAGLSVAFDASCEEMWLAWRYGACLVPAPRALVRTGIDLAPGWSSERSPSSPRCPRWRRCGRRRRWTRCGCSSSAARRARRSWRSGWRSRAARCGTRTARPRPRWWPARRS